MDAAEPVVVPAVLRAPESVPLAVELVTALETVVVRPVLLDVELGAPVAVVLTAPAVVGVLHAPLPVEEAV